MRKYNINNFPSNLQREIISMGISQHELARMSGVDQAIISRMLNGKRKPVLGTLVSILSALPDVTFEQLMK